MSDNTAAPCNFCQAGRALIAAAALAIIAFWKVKK